jgi:hypothetical protein
MAGHGPNEVGRIQDAPKEVASGEWVRFGPKGLPKPTELR